jgi:hypothetical protein
MVYSSKRNIYVDPNTDADYQSWNQTFNTSPIQSDTENDIWHLMQQVQLPWLYDGNTFSQPAIGQYSKVQLQNYAATIRLNKVNGGMVAAGIPTKTDDRTRGLIADARVAADNDVNFTTQWYGSDGNFYALDATTTKNMSDAVNKHTNDCYTVFANVCSDINLDNITTLAQIDAAFATIVDNTSAAAADGGYLLLEN